MSQDQDESQKTEEPTEKRLRDARQKGNLPISREAGTVLSVFVMLILASFNAPDAAGQIMRALHGLFANAHDIAIGDVLADPMAVNAGILWALLPSLAFVFGAFALGGIAAAAGQNAIAVAGDRIKPKLSNISPIKGVSRLFSWSSILEFVKGIVKIVLIGTVTGLLILADLERMELMVGADISALPALIREAAIELLLVTLIASAVIASADILWKRWDWRKKLRMTRQDVKDEHKHSEGDPQVKARVREIRRERARKRMMAAVPDSTVVIANPTHFAVALKYERGSMPAPLCVAKGVDQTALRIKDVAQTHSVPIIENRMLARALHATVEIDQIIPREHFEAVAEIITYVYKIDQRAVDR
ncbi:MAG: flagellar biosynthesis protein FlhB [Alphaproteobacteria bacterium]